jgi:hypothetical protein
MNRRQEALEHQVIFNQKMLIELAKNPGSDMRLGISFNQLGVAYTINERMIESFRSL